MTRGGRLRNAQALVDVTNADFPAREQPENPEPCRIREGLESVFQCRQACIVHGSIIFCLTYIPTDRYYRCYIRISEYIHAEEVGSWAAATNVLLFLAWSGTTGRWKTPKGQPIERVRQILDEFNKFVE